MLITIEKINVVRFKLSHFLVNRYLINTTIEAKKMLKKNKPEKKAEAYKMFELPVMQPLIKVKTNTVTSVKYMKRLSFFLLITSLELKIFSLVFFCFLTGLSLYNTSLLSFGLNELEFLFFLCGINFKWCVINMKEIIKATIEKIHILTP